MSKQNLSDLKNAPCTVEDIIFAIEEKTADGDYIFRGESQCHKKVSSTLYRALEKAGLLNEYDVETFQGQELKYAKTYRYTQKTYDFEILTEIQHFSGKTNLLDFTTDYRIALFFACNSFPFKDGRVILQNRNGKIKDWIMEPCDPDPESRVGKQKSIFVGSPKGFIAADKEVIIPKVLKKSMLEYLKKEFGVSSEIIYPDLHGFVSSQKARWKIYEEINKGNNHLESGLKAKGTKEGLKSYQKAIQRFTDAIDNSMQLDEGLAVAYDGRGSVYLSIGELDNSKGELEKAIADFIEAIKHKSNYPSAYKNRGRAYFAKGELENAIADFSKAIELMPRCPEAYHRRGLAYFHEGNLEDAIADLNEVIHLNPNDALAYHRRGIVYLRQGNFDSAITNLDKAIKLNPNDDLVYYSRGETWLHQKKWDKAKADLIAAKTKGMDVIAAFHNSHQDIADFERENGFKLPKDIVSLLTQL